MNRGNRKQIEGVKLIKGDRHHLGNLLKGYDFDVVFDVAAYTKQDVKDLLEGLNGVKDYILISSKCCLSGKFITTVQRGAEG